MNTAHSGTDIAIGFRRNGAGIQDNKVRFLKARGAFEPLFIEHGFERGAIRLRRAATEILNKVLLHYLFIVE